jgi:DNA-binding PucR family transcriptional regulator
LRAARCARLAREGVLAAEGLVITDEVLGALTLFADRQLLSELARVRLAPLAGLTAAAAERLEATLLSWLRQQGNVPSIARELHVHPQTVRYRLARLRECLGGALDEPDARFELELALRGKAAVVTNWTLRQPSDTP